MNSTLLKYNTNYIVYDNGTIFSIKLNRFIKLNKDKDGYLLVHTKTNGLRKCFKVHRLVAEHFIGNSPHPSYVVNHKDGNKQNNNVSNLEWVSRKQNSEHAVKNNLVATEFRLPITKLSDKDCFNVLIMRYQYNYTYIAIAKKFKVTHQLIARICRGKTRKRVYESYFSSNK